VSQIKVMELEQLFAILKDDIQENIYTKEGHLCISPKKTISLCAGGNIIVNRKLLESIDIIRDDFLKIAYEDVDLQLRLYKAGVKVVFHSRNGS
jgi:GT2 family glycosyltransferase